MNRGGEPAKIALGLLKLTVPNRSRGRWTVAKPPMQAAEVRAHERVVLDVGSRWIGALVVFGVFCWLVLLLVRDHHHPDWQAGGRLAWSLTILAAVAFIARGIFLSRPVTAGHTIAAMVAVFAGLGAHVLSFDLLGNVLIAGAGLALMWPTSARPQPDALPRVWALVNHTPGIRWPRSRCRC